MKKGTHGMGRWLAFACLLGIACTAGAGIKEVRQQVEASMLVTGAIIIEPEGAVEKLDIDQRDKLPEAVIGLVEKAAAGWKFEPILMDGVARRGKARMSLRVVANKLPNGDFQVALRGSHFGDEAISPEERQQRNDSVRSIKLQPPAYPGGAARLGAQGTVYLVVKVGRDGTVADVITEQVNLGFVGDERLMQQARDAFSEASLVAARKWTFQPPTEGLRWMRRSGWCACRWTTRCPGRRRRAMAGGRSMFPGLARVRHGCSRSAEKAAARTRWWRAASTRSARAGACSRHCRAEATGPPRRERLASVRGVPAMIRRNPSRGLVPVK